MSKLAILGGEKAVTCDPGDMFTWPIAVSYTHLTLPTTPYV